jgi:pyruvate/2-oxoacid:ferredoxin oxidoreductase beta subunit
MAFLHVLAPCPTGWRIPTELSVRIARLAVESRLFPLYEVRNGLDYRLSVESRGLPIEQYLRPQGRYAHFGAEDYLRVQQEVDEEWQRLLKLIDKAD